MAFVKGELPEKCGTRFIPNVRRVLSVAYAKVNPQKR